MAKLPAAQQYIGRGIDLPAPDLPDVCCNPQCDAPAFDLHHVTRRSFLAGPFPYVELFGRVWLNLAQVCRSCHDDLEQNRTQIAANLQGSTGYYTWAGRKLDPYPNPVLEDGESAGVFPPFHATGAGSPSSSTGGAGGPQGAATADNPSVTTPSGSGVTEGADGNPYAEPAPGRELEASGTAPSVTPGSTSLIFTGAVGDLTCEPERAPAPGETCPECNRRVPLPRKPSSPKTTTLGFRVPTDEKESIEAAWLQRAERMGISRLPHWRKHYLDITNSLIDGLSDDVIRAIGKDYLGDL